MVLVLKVTLKTAERRHNVSVDLFEHRHFALFGTIFTIEKS